MLPGDEELAAGGQAKSGTAVLRGGGGVRMCQMLEDTETLRHGPLGGRQ